MHKLTKFPLPRDGKWMTMGDVASVVSGGTPSTRDLDNFIDGDIPWITPADLSGYSNQYIASGKRNITRKGLKSSSARILPKNTVLFSSRAPIGYIAITANDLCTNQGFKNFVLKDNIFPKYAYWWLTYIKDLAISMGSGTTFSELSKTSAENLPFFLVPIKKQKEIVARIESLFGRLDDMVAAIKKIENDLTAVKNGTDDKFLFGCIGEQVKISDTADINPRINKKEIADALPVCFVPMESVGAGDGVIDTSNMRPFHEVKKGYKAFMEGDVLFAKITPCMENGKMAVVPKLKSKYGFGSTEFHVLRPKKGISAKYIYQVVSSQKFRDVAIRYMTGTAGQKRLPVHYLTNYKIFMPNLTIRNKKSKKLDKLYNLYDAVELHLRSADSRINVVKQVILSEVFCQTKKGNCHV